MKVIAKLSSAVSLRVFTWSPSAPFIRGSVSSCSAEWELNGLDVSFFFFSRFIPVELVSGGPVMDLWATRCKQTWVRLHQATSDPSCLRVGTHYKSGERSSNYSRCFTASRNR